MKTNLNKSSSFRNFNWDRAKTFYYVAQLETFTKASEFLNLSQPALSRQIASLERSLGKPLFIRGSRGLTLTRKGEELLEIISQTFDRLSDFTNKDKPLIERGKQRIIKVGIQRGYEYLVVGGLKSYYQAHSYLTFEIVRDTPKKSLQILDLDAAFRLYYSEPENHRYSPITVIGNNISVTDESTFIGSKRMMNVYELYMVIHSSSKDDEELKELYEHLKKVNTK